MPRGGHNKKSNARHEKDGTLNTTKHTKPVVDVKPVDAIPPAPDFFDNEHREKWQEVCGLLFEAGILARQDMDAVRTYVQTTILQSRAWQFGLINGIEVDEKGRLSAAFLAFERCDKILKPLREQFGFTPRSRQSINLAPPVEQEDPIMALLNDN